MPLLTKQTPSSARCTRCGTEFSADADSCPACGRTAGPQSARITLTITVILLFLGLGLTQYFVKLHRATEFSLANRCFLRGNQAMQANLPVVAAEDYRTALSYDPENREYRLRVAQALLAANRLNEARAHLTSLWDLEPANGEVNLTLARLYAKRGDPANASRYYSNAINGVWEDETRKERVAARFELANYLMQQGKRTQAQSELMALLADEPPDPADQLRLGELLLQVNEPEHTIEIDNAMLAKDPGNAQAYLQKAQALISLNKLVEAERALANAVERDPNSADSRRQLDLVREVLRLDTSLRGLSRTERADRAVEAFHSAWQRLSSCATQQGVNLSTPENIASIGSPTASDNVVSPGASPATPPDTLQMLYSSGLQKQAGVTQKALREDSDALDSTMQYVFDVERAAAPLCSQMSLTDRALLMLAQHESEGQK
jgi:tetratricopeptide (TPR) repeat protein